MDLNVWAKQLHSGPWDWMKDFFRNFRWAHQRVHKGFSDRDVWSLDYYWLALLPATMEALADQCHGHPTSYPDMESWRAEIRRVAQLLREADLDFSTQEEPYPEVYEDIFRNTEELPDGSRLTKMVIRDEEKHQANMEHNQKEQELRQQKLNEAFQWLSRHLYALWD